VKDDRLHDGIGRYSGLRRREGQDSLTEDNAQALGQTSNAPSPLRRKLDLACRRAHLMSPSTVHTIFLPWTKDFGNIPLQFDVVITRVVQA
jgi:hypothetical protein